MILKSVSRERYFRKASIIFLLANSLSMMLFFVVFDIKNYQKNSLILVFAFILFISLSLFLLDVANFKINKLSIFMLFVGAFFCCPILAFFLAPYFLLLIFFDVSGLEFWVCVILAASVFLMRCYLSVTVTSKIERKFCYVSNQIKMCDGEWVIDRNKIKDFDSLKRQSRKKGSRFTSVVFMTFFPFIYIGYPLQRLIIHEAGYGGVLFVLSLLSAPLALYVIGEISSGYYLWIHTIRKYEKKTKARILIIN